MIPNVYVYVSMCMCVCVCENVRVCVCLFGFLVIQDCIHAHKCTCTSHGEVPREYQHEATEVRNMES